MNKVVSLLFFSFLTLQMFAQDTTNQILSEEGYLKKSRAQKNAGWLLVGGGVGLFVIAGATAANNLNIDPFGTPSSGSTRDETFSTVLAVAGVGAILGGIVSFISAAQNKKKAASLSLNHRPLLLPVGSTLVKRRQPAISLKIPL